MAGPMATTRSPGHAQRGEALDCTREDARLRPRQPAHGGDVRARARGREHGKAVSGLHAHAPPLAVTMLSAFARAARRRFRPRV